MFYDIICPNCNIALPSDALTDLHSNLCRFCLAEYNRKLNIDNSEIIIRHTHLNNKSIKKSPQHE